MTATFEPAFVIDAHPLWWYWTAPERLGNGAQAAFSDLQTRRGIGYVPAIVVAEVHYLSCHLQRTLDGDRILALIDLAPGSHLEPITRAHLLYFGRLSEIPEMHDRLIGAIALMHHATLVSRDSVLRSITAIKTVW